MNEEKTANPKTRTSPVRETDPLLIRAWKVLDVYAKSTGTVCCVLDQDFLPIRESFPGSIGETNTCFNYCFKYTADRNPEDARNPQDSRVPEDCKIPDNSSVDNGAKQLPSRISDLRSHPCNMLHINSIKEAHRFEGSYIYMCELGFMFWTSPLYSEGRFIGALVGSGFIGIDRRETQEAMYVMSKGTVPLQELENRLSLFSSGESERIKALADLLLICAEYLSTGTEDYFENLRGRGETRQEPQMRTEILRNPRPATVQISGYPMDKERMLLAALRRGDNESGRKILNELLEILFYANPDQFKFVQFRAIELVVLLSRAAMGPGKGESPASPPENSLSGNAPGDAVPRAAFLPVEYPTEAPAADSIAPASAAPASAGDDSMLETNNRYLRRIQEAKSIEELTDVLHIIVERMSSQIFSFQGVRHASALRKAERYIWENYTRKLSLQEVASASGLSAPYFSSIFKEEMGENLSSYLNRLRVEKAGHMLTESDLSLNEIAASCGFEDQSWFSKIFKSFTGVSPGKYRGQGGGETVSN